MTLKSKGIIMAELMPADLIQQVVKRQEHECIEAMLSRIVADKPYRVMLHKEIVPAVGHGIYGEKESRVYIDVEPIPQVRTIYKAPEDLHLVPRKSMLAKLKNCWAYLCDNTGGYYEMTRVEDPKEK